MLRQFKKDIDVALKSFVREIGAKSDIKSTSGLLYAGIKDFVERDGKRIRPILFLLGYLGYTRKRKFAYKKLVKSAVSLELLHDFLLIHDDVIDNSDLRRGKPTLHLFFNNKLGIPRNDILGPSLGIVAGDIIFALAVKEFMSLNEDPKRKEQALDTFVKTTVSTGVGEFIDVLGNIKKIDQTREQDILQTYVLKTAQYTFSGPLKIGATLAGAKRTELTKLYKLGISLGKAFQIHDDLLDIFSTSKKTGKPTLSDLSESKKTLLVFHAFKTLTGKDKKDIKHILEKKQKTHKDLLHFKDLIIKSGSGEYCAKEALSLLNKSKKLASGLEMKKQYKDLIEEFIEGLTTKLQSLCI